MILVLEVVLLVYGVIAIVQGKFTVGTNRVLTGALARVAGLLLVLPLPVMLLVGVFAAAARAQGAIRMSADDLAMKLLYAEVGAVGVCVVLAALLALVAARPTDQQPAARPDKVPAGGPADAELWAEPVESEAVQTSPTAPAPAPRPARPRAPVFRPVEGAAVVQEGRGGVPGWAVALGVLGALGLGFAGGLVFYWQFFSAPAITIDRGEVAKAFAARAAGPAPAEVALQQKVDEGAKALARSEAAVRESNEHRAAAERDRDEARSAADKARGELWAARREADGDRYQRLVAAADRELGAGHVGDAEELLAASPPNPRGWEWRYLRRLCAGQFPPIRSGSVDRLLLDRDGRRVVTYSFALGKVVVRDTATGKETLTLPHRTSSTDMALSPDGKLLVVTGEQQPVRDSHTGEPLPGFGGAFDNGRVAFTPDGSRIVFVKSDNPVSVVTVHDAATGKQLSTWKIPVWGDLSVAVSPDGLRLAVSGMREAGSRRRGGGGILGGGTPAGGTLVVLCDLKANDIAAEIPGRHGPVAFSPDGTRLASLGADKTIKISDVSTGKELLSIAWPGHTEGVSGLIFHPDGTKLLSAGVFDGSVRLWDAASGRSLGALAARHERGVHAALSADGRVLAVSGQWTGDGRRNDDEQVRFWPGDGRPGPRRLPGELARVNALAFSPDGKRLAAAHADGAVRIWDPEAGVPAVTLTGHNDMPRAVCWSPDGKQLASVASAEPPEPLRAGEVRIWDAATGAAARSLAAHRLLTRYVAWSPDGKTLAAGGWVVLPVDRASWDYGDFRVWDPATGKELEHVAPTKGIGGLAYDDRGRLVTAGAGDDLRVSDPLTGNRLSNQRVDANNVKALALGSRANRFAVLDNDGVLSVQGFDDAKASMKLKLTGGAFHALAFTPDGRRLATGGADGTVRVWDPAAGRETIVLRGHGGPVTCVAFSHDGARLASAAQSPTGKGSEVFVWEAGP
jgi:WD40 repeat protein